MYPKHTWSRGRYTDVPVEKAPIFRQDTVPQCQSACDITFGGMTFCFGMAYSLKNVSVSCTTSNMAHLIVGDLKGVVRVISSDFTLVSKFTAYTGSVKFLAHNMENNCLVEFCCDSINAKVTVGHDEEATSATVRFWDLSQKDNEGNPICFLDTALNSQLPVCNWFGIFDTQASALAVSADMHTTMIGLCDGNLCVLSGNARKGKLRQHEIVVQSGNPITNLVYSATCTRY